MRLQLSLAGEVSSTKDKNSCCSCTLYQLFLPQVTTRLNSGSKFCSECQENVLHNVLRLWSLFYYSTQKTESLKHEQAVLNLPELKVIKPSDTRWLSHERCVCAILKKLYTCIDHHVAKHL